MFSYWLLQQLLYVFANPLFQVARFGVSVNEWATNKRIGARPHSVIRFHIR